ncbi:glycoside hydrolase family 5 protein [Piromyces sp. E2]|nr:glycoside hydrolase family 5 protein [Piromyces sp. E2]|eukprot:OUM63623.1 glycoside hydrolase family 5 protein [Piromyces sp. E2]
MKFLNTLAIIVKDIKIGWNLGNTLDANCLEFLDYSLDQTASETCLLNPRATQEFFDKLSGFGFNIFRIPTTWTGHFGDGPDYKIDESWMKRVHEVVQYAINTGSYAILNVHHEEWNYAFSDNLESAKVILEALWKQIAAEFEEFDEHLIFEGMNEPRKVNTDVEWNGGDEEGWNFVNEMNELFMKTIRTSGGNNEIRHLMIPTYAAALNEHTLEAFKYPNDDDKVILDKDIPVIIGEFGAMSRNNEDDRNKWATTFVGSTKELGVPCILWENGVFEGDGELFGIIDRTELTVTFLKYLKGLMAGIGNTLDIPDVTLTIEIPTVEPPTVEPPTTETPTIEPPMVEPSTVEPPTVEPSIVQPPTVQSPTVQPPTTETPAVQPPTKSEECYKQVSECWGSNQNKDEYSKLNEICSKIWN